MPMKNNMSPRIRPRVKLIKGVPELLPFVSIFFLLTVFFMPLVTAGVHLAFAFPIIRRLLMMFGVTNTPFLVGVTVCCYLVFALFYVVVYRMTSRSYYGIVSGMQQDS